MGFLLRFNKFSLALFILISLPVYSVGEIDECSEGDINEFVTTLFDSNCLDLGEDKRCNCLENQRPDDAKISRIDSKNKILQYQENLRSKRTKNFWEVYTQMINGAAMQAKILDPKGTYTTQEKVVGCTASEMSKEIKSKILNHLDVKKGQEEAALKAKIAEFKICEKEKRDCQTLKNEINVLEEDFKEKQKDEYEKICESIKLDNNKTSAQIQLETAKIWFQSTPMNDELKNTKIKKIDCYLIMVGTSSTKKEDYLVNGCVDATGVWSALDKTSPSAYNFTINMPAQTQKIMDENSPGSSAIASAVAAGRTVANATAVVQNYVTCSLDSEKIKTFMEEFDNEKIAYLKSNGETPIAVASISDCGTDVICNSFDQVTKAALKAQGQAIEQVPGYCKSYSDFLLNRSVPGDAFMQQLAQTPDDKLGNLLKTPAIINSEADKQRLNFLKTNPLISKIVFTGQNQNELGLELKKVAIASQGKTHAEKLNSFLTFMKGPVKNILSSDDFKNSEKYICEQMINNYSAIQVSNDLPPFKEEPNELPLVSALRSCDLSLNRATSVSAATGLFSLIDQIDQGDSPSAALSDAEQFKAYNLENCKGFDQFAKQECGGEMNKRCVSKFHLSKPKTEEDKVLDSQGTARDIDQEAFNQVAKYSTDKSQDSVHRSVGSRIFGRKTSKTITPFRNSVDPVLRPVDKEKSLPTPAITNQNTSLAPLSNSSAFVPVKTPANLKPNSPFQANPGQVIPPFNKPPVAFNPEKLASNSDITKSIENYDQLTHEDKASGLRQVKNYLNENKDSLASTELEEKIAETNKKLDAELAKQQNLASKYSSFNYSSTSISNNSNKSNFVPDSQSISAPVSPSSSSSADIRPPSSIGQNASRMNDALNSIHKDNSASQGRTPASSTGSKEIIIKSGVVNSDQLNGKLVVSQELIASSESEFKKISTDIVALELYLKANLIEQGSNQGRIISISDPSSKVPAQNLIFRVVLENGKYLVQSIPSNVKVERVSTLQRLKLNLKSIQ